MNIRTITIGLPFLKNDNIDIIEIKVKKFLDIIEIYSKKKNTIRTIRINLTPINLKRDEELNKLKILGLIDKISKIAEAFNIRWLNIPFNLLEAKDKDITLIKNIAFEIIKRYPKTFINFIVAQNNKINYQAMIEASRFIKDVSRLDDTGFNNFRVGVSCNIQANTPFFPFTFSSNELGFSIGLELPQEMNKIIKNTESKNLNVLRDKFFHQIVPKMKTIEQISKRVEKETDVIYHGLDASLAPYPEEEGSIAKLIESLGLEYHGCNGTLFMTAYLTSIIKKMINLGNIKSVGFNGVMYSLLEDEFMGKRNNNQIYSIDSLISYSAVCGCGLDMVPIPGDTFEEEMASIMLDIASLSLTLSKPLGIRLLPIPMKHENEFTAFNMDFLYNTRIKKTKNISFSNDDFKKESFSL